MSQMNISSNDEFEGYFWFQSYDIRPTCCALQNMDVCY